MKQEKAQYIISLLVHINKTVKIIYDEIMKDIETEEEPDLEIPEPPKAPEQKENMIDIDKIEYNKKKKKKESKQLNLITECYNLECKHCKNNKCTFSKNLQYCEEWKSSE